MGKFKGLPDRVVNDVRGGWRDLVALMGGVDRASRICAVSVSQVSIYGSLHGDSLPSLATVLAAEADVGKPLVTEALARATRHALVPIEPMAEGELAALLARVGAETGEVFGRYGAALADDGQVNAAEKLAIIRELQDLQRAVHAALGHLHAPPVAPAPMVSAA